MATLYVIRADEKQDDEALYWSNSDGWVNLGSATIFTEEDSKTLDLPADPCAWIPTNRWTKPGRMPRLDDL